MLNRHAALALSALVFALAASFALPAHADADTSVLTAVKDVSAQADKFRGLMANLSASQIHVVAAQSALTDANRNAYEAALKKNAPAISQLRDTLSRTTLTDDQGVITTLTKVLKAQNVSVDSVVGVYVGSDGSVTLFYQ